MPYQHILVAVDLSEECHDVVEHAIALAQTHKARLSLCHAVEPIAMAFSGEVPMDLSLLQQQQQQQAEELLGTFSKHYPSVERSAWHLTYGQPRAEIHRLVAELDCDLIVVGSHGRHGLALLLGSTANDLLHGAPCDVLAKRLNT
ncbi:universal stress protein A [Atopomonas hussainii]|uniref:Universal stress protein n=1 Tax=Atopomonas hussainii TaxID=1429083 RepID=A0A1H7KSR1_9GAMM|nr:universal stress protein [Atopomonas hussainii]SEK89580.1 universal stress protein A [Atopomonas hussainii]